MTLHDDDIYTVEADNHDGTTVQTLRLSSAGPAGLTTGASDTPSAVFYPAYFREFAIGARSAFGDRRTSGSADVADGDVILNNSNAQGAPLDQYRSRAFDGRTLTIRRGQLAGAYPSSYRTLMRAPMHAPLWGYEDLTLRVRDARKLTSVPLQTTLYAGSNVAGVGLEGTADDLKGKPKPVAFGRSFNVPLPCVNAQKNIYQFHDGPNCTVTDVRDGGLSLGVGSGSAATWTSRTSGFGAGNTFYAVTYGNSLYVAAGAVDATSVGILVTSPDGVTWTTRTLPSSPKTVAGLAYGAGLFVTVGGLNTVAGQIYTSPDGVTWTARTSSFGTTGVLSVVFSSERTLFVAGGFGGKLATSPDGVTWTQRTNPFAGTSDVFSIAYGAGLFVATAGTSEIATSPDGINWTLRTVALATAKYNSVGYSSLIKLFIVGGFDTLTGLGGTGTAATSEDGVTWTRRDGPIGSSVVTSVATSGIVFAVVGFNGVLGTSTNGLDWTVQTGQLGGATKFAATYGGGSFVAVGSAGQIYQTTAGTYSTIADLQDDSLQPAHGSYKIYSGPEGSYLRLGSPPA